MKRLILDHAFHAVDAVEFRVHSDNLRSQRAVEKLGAIRVGIEADTEGRGENIVFRLEAPNSTTSIDGPTGSIWGTGLPSRSRCPG